MVHACVRIVWIFSAMGLATVTSVLPVPPTLMINAIAASVLGSLAQASLGSSPMIRPPMLQMQLTMLLLSAKDGSMDLTHARWIVSAGIV